MKYDCKPTDIIPHISVKYGNPVVDDDDDV